MSRSRDVLAFIDVNAIIIKLIVFFNIQRRGRYLIKTRNDKAKQLYLNLHVLPSPVKTRNVC